MSVLPNVPPPAILALHGLQSATLPYPPSANRYWRHYRGRVVLSEEAEAYIAEAGWVAKTAGMKPLDGDVDVQIRVFRPRRTGDLDNCLKVLIDSLRGIAYHDDSQIVGIVALRDDDPANPRVHVSVYRRALITQAEESAEAKAVVAPRPLFGPGSRGGKVKATK